MLGFMRDVKFTVNNILNRQNTSTHSVNYLLSETQNFSEIFFDIDSSSNFVLTKIYLKLNIIV